jgi:acetyltransferase
MQLGRKGTGCAIVIASGLENLHTAQGTNLQEQMKQIAAHWNIRLLGPNSLGFIAPAIGLNASYAHTQAQPGKIAFLSQSSAMCTALLDWSRRRRIGFSYMISLGDAVDIDFDELIDYLGRDPATTAILFYIDSISDGRAFLSAARAASFNKPLLVIKAGGQVDSTQLLSNETNQPPGLDAVYDAAFRRAGMLRVGDLRELMAAVETLANGKPIRGEKLVIVSNGKGPSAMAVDTLLQRGGKLEHLSDTLIADTEKMLRPGSRALNPIHLLGDATPEEYANVLARLLSENTIEYILLIHARSLIKWPAQTNGCRVRDIYVKNKNR